MNQETQTTEARIVEAFGRRAIAECMTGERVACEVFGKRLSVVCGDRIRLSFAHAQDIPRIVERSPRSTLFSRTDAQGRVEELAANLTLVLVVLAPEPKADPFVADRYLAGAALAGINAAILANKSDLSSAQTEEYRTLLTEYAQAGYRVLELSVPQEQGVEALREMVRNDVAMLVGQSGVGKSSLTNVLVPLSLRPTRAISTSTREGRHTTVSTAMFRVATGGELIDPPGVRDYAPAPVADAQIQVGWPEILRLAPECRFRDCLHLREPACAVRHAVESGAIAVRRYESYKRLMNLMRQLLPSYERQ